MDSWDDLRYFLAVAREGSLSGAARRLRVNHSTVYRRLGALEERIDARLFERLPRGYVLTVAGEQMLGRVERIEEELLSLEREAHGHDLRLSGAVRITTTDTVATLCLPHFRDFLTRYPEIELEVVVDNRSLSLTRREADVALRPGSRPEEGVVVGTRLCGIAWAVYASPGYFERRGVPADPSALAGHDLITGDESLSHLQAASWLAARVKAPGAYRSNSVRHQQEAAQAGQGLAALPCFLGDRAAGLRRLFPPIEGATTSLWLLIHGDLRQTARVRAFVDFISDAIRDERDLLEGREAEARAAGAAAPRSG